MRKLWQYNVKGLSLVGLLISIVLGAFLIVVMLQIFSATRASYKLAQNLSEVNDIMRYASLTINDVVSQAGYRNPVSGVLPSYSTAFPTFTNTLTGPTSGTYDTGETNADNPAGVVLSYFPGEDVFVTANGSDYNDKVWVKFEGSAAGKIRACNDLYGVEGTSIMVRLYSRSVTSNNAATTSYFCERQDDGEDYTYTDGTVSGTPLIPTALYDQAWVRYGEDLTGNGFIDRWALGADVQNRNRVYAVRFAFLVHTRDDVRTESKTQTFSVFGESISRSSKKIYKLYMFTVLLPNAPNYPLAGAVGTP